MKSGLVFGIITCSYILLGWLDYSVLTLLMNVLACPLTGPLAITRVQRRRPVSLLLLELFGMSIIQPTDKRENSPRNW